MGIEAVQWPQDVSVDASASAVPERVSVAMTEIAENMSEGLLALAVGAGLQVMAALMEADMIALAPARRASMARRARRRHGYEHGSVTLGGRRVPVTRPRVRAADGSAELRVASYELFSSTEILGKLAMEKILAGPPRGATRSGLSRSVSGSPKSFRRRTPSLQISGQRPEAS